MRYFYGHLDYVMGIRFIFTRSGMLYKDKSGNPDRVTWFFVDESCHVVPISAKWESPQRCPLQFVNIVLQSIKCRL
jgi:hypothetical protein